MPHDASRRRLDRGIVDDHASARRAIGRADRGVRRQLDQREQLDDGRDGGRHRYYSFTITPDAGCALRVQTTLTVTGSLR